MNRKADGYYLRVAGAALLAIGLLLALAGFTMATTGEWYSNTLNVGLLNDQSNRITAGGFSAVCGAVLYAAGAIVGAIGRSAAATEQEDV